MEVKLMTFSELIQLHSHTRTQDTTEATRSCSWLIYTAAIQMRIAEDVWWFSNLCSCHREMGRADPLSSPQWISNSPTSPSPSPSNRYLRPPLCRPPALQMSGRMLPQPHPCASPGWGWPAWYNVMLTLGKGSTLTCCVEFNHKTTDIEKKTALMDSS